MKRATWLTLLLALVLALALLAGCGGQDAQPSQDPAPASGGTQEPAQTPAPEAPKPQPEAPETAPEAPKPQPEAPETAPEAPKPEPEAPETAPEAPKPQPEAPETAPETPKPEPEPAPEPPAGAVPEDGAYTAAVTLEGGTGKARVESPAKLRCENGQFWATIVWSSPNYDYMKVDGEKYSQINTEGNSVFEIPVSAFDQKLDVIADTVAMSEPHEIEYTLYFDSASLQKQ